MTRNEAITFFEHLIPGNAISKETIRMAIEALKQQQPVKPIRFEKKSKVTRDKYECGACGSSEVFKEWEYCPWCGKPIDWSKEGDQE